MYCASIGHGCVLGEHKVCTERPFVVYKVLAGYRVSIRCVLFEHKVCVYLVCIVYDVGNHEVCTEWELCVNKAGVQWVTMRCSLSEHEVCTR